MAGVSFLIRVLPMVLLRKPIKNRFIKSFLYYVPYVTLAVMTCPAILEVTDQPLIGAAALVAGIVLAYLGAGLFPVAIACCVLVFVLQLIA
jgi:branched-subunit amino acid transport protein